MSLLLRPTSIISKQHLKRPFRSNERPHSKRQQRTAVALRIYDKQRTRRGADCDIMEGSTAPGGGATKEGPSSWSRVHGRTTDAADAFFYSLGYWVSKNAKLTLALSLGAVISCCFGFVNLDIVTAGNTYYDDGGNNSYCMAERRGSP